MTIQDNLREKLLNMHLFNSERTLQILKILTKEKTEKLHIGRIDYDLEIVKKCLLRLPNLKHLVICVKATDDHLEAVGKNCRMLTLLAIRGKLDAISIGSNSMTIYDIRSSWVFRTSLRSRDFIKIKSLKFKKCWGIIIK